MVLCTHIFVDSVVLVVGTERKLTQTSHIVQYCRVPRGPGPYILPQDSGDHADQPKIAFRYCSLCTMQP
jgi:hypothetical protein